MENNDKTIKGDTYLICSDGLSDLIRRWPRQYHGCQNTRIVRI